jgi:hypothetical protein
MLYVVEVTVPANTPESSPVEEELFVDSGVITKIEVLFPPGTAAKVWTRALIGHYQLFPRPFGAWLKGDGEKVEADMYYPVSEGGELLRIQAVSPATLYQHTIIYRFTVLPTAIAFWWYAIEKLINLLSALFGLRREWIISK